MIYLAPITAVFPRSCLGNKYVSGIIRKVIGPPAIEVLYGSVLFSRGCVFKCVLVLWLLWAEVAGLTALCAWNTVSVCFFIDLYVFLWCLLGELQQAAYDWLNVVKGQFWSASSSWTERRMNSWCCTWPLSGFMVNWFRGFFFSSLSHWAESTQYREASVVMWC